MKKFGESEEACCNEAAVVGDKKNTLNLFEKQMSKEFPFKRTVPILCLYEKYIRLNSMAHAEVVPPDKLSTARALFPDASTGKIYLNHHISFTVETVRECFSGQLAR